MESFLGSADNLKNFQLQCSVNRLLKNVMSTMSYTIIKLRWNSSLNKKEMDPGWIPISPISLAILPGMFLSCSTSLHPLTEWPRWWNWTSWSQAKPKSERYYIEETLRRPWLKPELADSDSAPLPLLALHLQSPPTISCVFSVKVV